jgi:hypothetical protein
VPVDYFIVAAGEWLAMCICRTPTVSPTATGPRARHDQLGSVFAALAASPADPHLVLELRDRDDIPDAMAYLERNGLAC